MPPYLSVGAGNSSREKGACSSPGQSQFVVPDQWVDNEWGQVLPAGHSLAPEYSLGP